MENNIKKNSYFKKLIISSLTGMVIISLFSGCAPGMSMSAAPAFIDQLPNTEYNLITLDLINKINEENAQKSQLRKEQIQGVATKDNYKYLIGPRDILSVTVWDHPELTIPAGSFRSAEAAGHLVAEDGTIFFPHAGKVKVAGKTIPQVRDLLTRAISDKIASPQLDIRVVAFRSQKVYVVGEVEKPGPLPISDTPLTVVEAINLAGDITVEANLLDVTLTRGQEVINIDLTKIYAGDFTQNYLLKDGDILRVPDRNLQKIFVLGEVATPSSIFMHKGQMSLAEAISDAGGVDRVTSSPERIYVIRGEPDNRQIYHLDGRSPDALILGDLFKLQARDIVYVDTAGITKWNRVIEQLLPTVDMLYLTSEIYRRNDTKD